MITTTNQTAFHPYKIVNEGRTSLELKPVAAQKIVVFTFRFIPVLLLVIGLIFYFTQKDTLYLFTFGGIALLEAFIFSFIKIPGTLTMDAVGFNLETLSIKGKKETYYLWNDVDFIRYRKVRSKNNTSLTYDAMLKSGKKISFLTFGNYHSKKHKIEEINSILHEISNKEIRDK